MKILINAITVKEGGGQVFFYKTLNAMVQQEKNIQWIVVIDGSSRDKIIVNDQVTLITFPWIKKSAFHLLYWNEIILPRLIKEMNIHCVFSLVNMLPIRKLRCPTFLSILQAGYFSKEFMALNAKYNNTPQNKIGWFVRKYLTFSSIKKATQITTPTKALSDQITKQLKISAEKIRVILPGLGLVEGEKSLQHFKKEKIFRIGYITKYGVQKNFDLLFKTATILKMRGIHFRLILTLNTRTSQFQHVDSLIKKYSIADCIENHGELSEEKLCALYSTLRIFVFPSLCESIGFTLLEAMHYGLPIIASDIQSNKELLGDQGVFFHADDDIELANKIVSVIQDENVYQQLSCYSIIRARHFSWEKTAKETLQALKELTCLR